MRVRDRWITLIVAFVGMTVCLIGVVGFIWSVSSNNLPWDPNKPAREYYLEVGSAYGDGFIMGFFLCFFLVLAALAIGAWLGYVQDHSQKDEPESTNRGLRIVRGRDS